MRHLMCWSQFLHLLSKAVLLCLTCNMDIFVQWLCSKAPNMQISNLALMGDRRLSQRIIGDEIQWLTSSPRWHELNPRILQGERRLTSPHRATISTIRWVRTIMQGLVPALATISTIRWVRTIMQGLVPALAMASCSILTHCRDPGSINETPEAFISLSGQEITHPSVGSITIKTESKGDRGFGSRISVHAQCIQCQCRLCFQEVQLYLQL